MQEIRYEIDLPSADLATTLIELGDLFSVNIAAKQSLVAGKTAPAIKGMLTAEEAIAEALTGSGLLMTKSRSGAYIVSAQNSAVEQQATDSDSEDPALDEIVVIGTKQGFSVQETTSSVEIFDSERLKNEVLFSLNDTLARSANTSVLGNNLDTINIRGIDRNGTEGAGAGQAINIFVDGAPVSGIGLGGINTLWDTEQVEVLRGSQSAVQGRNAIAGAVIVESKKPTFEWEGAMRARFAELGTRQYAGVISGPIIDDQVAFRLSADYQTTDGFITDGISGRDANAQETLTVRGRALIEPDAMNKLSALVTLEYADRTVGRLNNFVFTPSDSTLEAINDGLFDLAVDRDILDDFDPLNAVSFPTLPIDRETDALKAVAEFTYEFSDAVSVVFLGTYENAKNDFNDFRRNASEFGPLGFQSKGEDVTYTAELRLEFAFDRLSGLIGGYYFDFENNLEGTLREFVRNEVPFPIRPADSLLLIDQNATFNVENSAFFTSWRFEPDDTWDIDVGLRYDNERYSSLAQFSNARIVPADECEGDAPGFIVGQPDVPLVTIPCTLGLGLFVPPAEPLQSDNFDVWLPSGAVTYNINEDFSIFAGVRRGYRAGGTFLSTNNESAERFRVVTFDPEFLLSYEAGWRSVWFDGKLIFNGTAFYSDYTDQQINFIDGDNFSNTTNAGETAIYGLELSADYHLTNEWNVYASVGLLETDIEELVLREDNPDTPDVDETIDLAGNELGRSPNLTFTVGMSYAHESGFFGSASLNYRSAYETDFLNLGPEDLDVDDAGNPLTERVDEATLVNARLGYEFNRFTLSVFGTNLLDEDNPESINIGNAGALFTPPTDTAINEVQSYVLRQPRTLGVSLDAAF
ncbi:MAG: TonB-dependent receptor [Pseudomonadota bacterium]